MRSLSSHYCELSCVFSVAPLCETLSDIFWQRRSAGIQSSSGDIVFGSGQPEVMSNSPGRDGALALQLQDTVVSLLGRSYIIL